MPGPLSQLKILDFSGLLPGPFATMFLADLGADVIRIESPTRPDLLRYVPPMQGELSVGHLALNRNKRSISLDLKQPGAVETIHGLLETHDIVLEQFRPGVMQRLGLDYERLRQVNPALIYCSLTGYGQQGPLSQRAGHDINYLAVSGSASITGRRRSGPLPAGQQIADIGGGSYPAVIGILAAVIHRQQTGEGQHIDVAMADGALAFNSLFAAGALTSGRDPGREDLSLNGAYCHYDYFATADNRWLSVGSLEPQFCRAFVTALGKPEWFEKAFDHTPAVQAEMKEKIADLIRSESAAHWMERFQKTDACVELVLSFTEAADHPHYKERGMIVTLQGEGGQTRQVACPIRFSRTPAEYRFPGRPVGADNQEILGAP